MQNNIYKTLVDLGVCDEKTVVPYHNKVRDRDDISVLQDKKSGVIFLDKTNYMNASHYEQIKECEYWNTENRKQALEKLRVDDERRAKFISSYIKNKDYVDIGCGAGGVMDILKPIAKSVSGVELQENMRNRLEEDGYVIYKASRDLPVNSFDIASLFHVFEHLTEPIKTLKEVYKALKPGGMLIVEVPYAKDALLKLESFKDFSLWSEHLILHTRDSLYKILEVSGFTNIKISGFQRYPLSNHLGWLLFGEPGGQESLLQFKEEKIEQSYIEKLNETDQTDTIIAVAYKR